MKVLMVGVDEKRYGGMWTVASNYINSEEYNKKVNLEYVATSTNGSAFKRLFFMLKGFYKIAKLLNKKDFDIVHIHMAEKGSTFRKGYVAKMANKKGSKVIIQLHAGPFMAWYNDLSESKKQKIIKIFGYADKVLVLGEYWKKELSTLIDDKKMSVLYNGVTIPSKNLYKLSNRNIVYMGVLKREKGIYDLIEAIDVIKNKLPEDAKVLLCGNDLEGDIAEVIKSKNLNDRIQMLGWINEKERDSIYRKARISVLPSYFEALSMTIIEAMSYGIPIITTDISTMKEILGDKSVLVQPGDVKALANHILEMFDDDKLLMSMSKDEYKIAQNTFSINHNVDRTIEIYEEVMDGEN